ncbi:MAG TPA: ubiquinone/menaquinone biosynthesis methyltransferase [Chthoniobacterales bacterium]|jgi:demethylmenaquinone methyltransferase/2-methoxy-6-polyprenyl-1,4-benzoquinol methylase|nr:ubiquinone/menaquinone biosynthesis methyltransferase [Chthoniobacterales bacterium]
MQTDFSATDPLSIREMFGRVAGRYDRANQILSLGIDSHWRRVVSSLVASWHPQRILDLATGSGILAQELHRQSPEAYLVCADFCAPMLQVAKHRGLTNLIVADGMALPFIEGAFDVVTIAFGLRNMESFAHALTGISRILRPGGHVVILDFSLPTGPLRPFYRFYLHFVLPRLAGLITGHSTAYQYLGESIERFPRGRGMLDLLARTGFRNAKLRSLTGGIVAIYYAEKTAENNERQ